LSDPARRNAEVSQKLFRNLPEKNSVPKKQFFDFLPKKIQVPRAWLNAAWNSEPCV
jgi:hypothetical protein